MKFSDYAKEELNKLANKHFWVFVVIILTIGLGYIIWSYIGALYLLPLPAALLAWLCQRSRIIQDNKEDIERETSLRIRYDGIAGSCSSVKEKLYDKELTFARFANEEEIAEVVKNDFLYKIVLNNNEHSVLNIYSKVNTAIYCNITSLYGDFIKIKESNCLLFLPNLDITIVVLDQIFQSMVWQYHKQKSMEYNDIDYTIGMINDIHEKAKQHYSRVVSANYQDVLKILSGKEKFKIFGAVVKKNNKKLIIVTAVRIKDKYITLLPTQTIADLFSKVQSIVDRRINN